MKRTQFGPCGDSFGRLQYCSLFHTRLRLSASEFVQNTKINYRDLRKKIKKEKKRGKCLKKKGKNYGNPIQILSPVHWSGFSTSVATLLVLKARLPSLLRFSIFDILLLRKRNLRALFQKLKGILIVIVIILVYWQYLKSTTW